MSPGCKHCYAETFAERFRGVKGHPFEQGFDPRLVPEKLNEPPTWNRSDIEFTNIFLGFRHCEPLLEDLGRFDLTDIHWVIVGGESGGNARELDIQWVDSIIQQRRAAGVPVFTKQLGAKPVGPDGPFRIIGQDGKLDRRVKRSRHGLLVSGSASFPHR